MVKSYGRRYYQTSITPKYRPIVSTRTPDLLSKRGQSEAHRAPSAAVIKYESKSISGEECWRSGQEQIFRASSRGGDRPRTGGRPAATPSGRGGGGGDASLGGEQARANDVPWAPGEAAAAAVMGRGKLARCILTSNYNKWGSLGVPDMPTRLLLSQNNLAPESLQKACRACSLEGCRRGEVPVRLRRRCRPRVAPPCSLTPRVSQVEGTTARVPSTPSAPPLRPALLPLLAILALLTLLTTIPVFALFALSVLIIYSPSSPVTLLVLLAILFCVTLYFLASTLFELLITSYDPPLNGGHNAIALHWFHQGDDVLPRNIAKRILSNVTDLQQNSASLDGYHGKLLRASYEIVQKLFLETFLFLQVEHREAVSLVNCELGNPLDIRSLVSCSSELCNCHATYILQEEEEEEEQEQEEEVEKGENYPNNIRSAILRVLHGPDSPISQPLQTLDTDDSDDKYRASDGRRAVKSAVLRNVLL
ncbi:Protein of unknown function [Gryllus bimaculatus]|nr:Protein of unknown function [Gryllus bimaculatus]